MSKCTKIKCLKLNAHKFQKIGDNGNILFVHVGKDEIHKYMQYEVSKTVCVGSVANHRKVPKWLLLTTMCQNDKIFDVYMSQSQFGHVCSRGVIFKNWVSVL